MYLGIEIGGTKLQLAVGNADGSPPVVLKRTNVDPARGAAGILEEIERHGAALIQRHDVHGIGIGFGGPVDAKSGVTLKSHQIAGWENVPLCDLVTEWLGVPSAVDNDCNVAALAEAKLGAGQGVRALLDHHPLCWNSA